MFATLISSMRSSPQRARFPSSIKESQFKLIVIGIIITEHYMNNDYSCSAIPYVEYTCNM